MVCSYFAFSGWRLRFSGICATGHDCSASITHACPFANANHFYTGKSGLPPVPQTLPETPSLSALQRQEFIQNKNARTSASHAREKQLRKRFGITGKVQPGELEEMAEMDDAARAAPPDNSGIARGQDEANSVIVNGISENDRSVLRAIASKILDSDSEDELILLEMDLEHGQQDPSFSGLSSSQSYKLALLRGAANARRGAIRDAKSPFNRVSGHQFTAEMNIRMAPS